MPHNLIRQNHFTIIAYFFYHIHIINLLKSYFY